MAAAPKKLVPVAPIREHDEEGDPDAVSPELGRFLDWLADEALKEMLGS